MLKKILLTLVILMWSLSVCTFASYSYYENYEGKDIDQKNMSYVIKTANAGGFGKVEYDATEDNHYYNFGNFYNSTAFTEKDTYLQYSLVDLTKGKFVFGFSLKYVKISGNGGDISVTFRHADNSSTIHLMNFARNGTVTYLKGFNPDASNIVKENMDVYSWQHFKFVTDIPNDCVSVYRNGKLVAQAKNFLNATELLNTYNYSKLWIRLHGNTSNKIAAGSEGNLVSFGVDDIYGFNDNGIDDSILIGTGKMREKHAGSIYDVSAMRKGIMSYRIIADNATDTDKSLKVFKAVYDSFGKMIDFSSSDEIEIKAGKVTFTEYDFESTYNDNDKSMKIMFVDGENNIKPVAPFAEYVGKGNLSPRPETVLADLKKKHPDNSHPRLWVTQEKFDELSVLVKNTEPYKTWYTKVIKQADNVVNTTTLPEYEDTDTLRLKSAGTVCDNLMKLSFAYKMTGQEKYIEAIKANIVNAAAWPDWNPKHFLDTATVAQGFGFAYDWCYDYWQTEDMAEYKEMILTKIRDYGLNEAYKKYTSASPWSNNWSMVCNGGIAQAATAVMDEPGLERLASECVAYGLDWLLTVTPDFAPDGGWYEGISYWSYLMQYMTVHFSTLESAFGTDYDYPEITGIAETGYFPISMIGKKNTFNIHDSGESTFSSPYFLYLAKRFNNKDFANYRYRQIKEYNYSISMYDLLWFEPELVADYNNYEFDKKDFLFSEVCVASFRDDYFSKNNLYAVLHGGVNQFSHGQLDAGTFAYETDGIRWAVDLGSDSYNLHTYFGGKPTEEKSRWAYYRNRAEGHNTFVVNPGLLADQNPAMDARIESFEADEMHGMAVVDMAAVTGKSVKKAKRGMYLDKINRSLLIRDELTFAADDNTYYWFMHTKATIKLSEDGKSAILEQSGKRLWAGIVDGDGVFTVEKAVPLETSPNPDEWEENKDNLGDSVNPTKQNANEAFSKLRIKKEHLSGNYNVTVMLIPLESDESKPASIPADVSIASWK